MANNRIDSLSVRAQSWVGAQLVRAFCRRRGIKDQRLEKFCEYIEELATATDVPAWDSRCSDLEVAGLGDPLPSELEQVPLLREIVENVQEIIASQIYGAWQPQLATRHLLNAARIAGVDLHDGLLPSELWDHNPEAHGWGQPVDEATLCRWRCAT